jgi:hypothetical protein
MIAELWRRLIHPHPPTPPPPDVELTSDDEQDRINRRRQEVTAVLERLRLDAERPALRHLEDGRNG